MSSNHTPIKAPMFLVVVMVAAPSVAQAQVNYQDLRSRVFRSVDRGIIQVSEPTFDWSGDRMRYDLSPGCEPSPDKDPLEKPFAELLTVAAIKKYRMRNPRQRQFWSSVLPKVEKEIERMVAIVGEQGQTPQHMLERIWESSIAISHIYHQELDTLAKREGKVGAWTGKECAMHVVSARAEPSNATIKYMRSGAYLLHICFHDGSPPDWSDVKWETAPTGGEFTIGEKTRFHIRWDDGFERTGLISAQAGVRTWTLVISRARGFRWER